MVVDLQTLIDKGVEQFNLSPYSRNPDPAFIPVHLTGGIGDVVMAMETVEFLNARYDIIVYTPHVEAFKYFNKDIQVLKDFPEFTWSLEVDTLIKFAFNRDFKGFLVKEHEELYLRQQSAFANDPKLETLAQTHSQKYYLIARHAKDLGLNRRQMPMYSLGFKEPMPDMMNFTFGRINNITIHDGFDVHHRHIVSGRATKTWDLSHWHNLCGSIKRDYPEYKIIQLGASPTARPILGVDECLIDKTTITEAFNLVRTSSLHIDGDSGLVHVASKFLTPAVVMWGPTPDRFYGYSWNQNLRSDVCQGSCYGVKSDWSDRCPIGYVTPLCMDTITPDMVMTEVRRILK